MCVLSHNLTNIPLLIYLEFYLTVKFLCFNRVFFFYIEKHNYLLYLNLENYSSNCLL